MTDAIILNARATYSGPAKESEMSREKQHKIITNTLYDRIYDAWQTHGIPYTTTNNPEVDAFLEKACLLYRGFVDEYKTELGIAFLSNLANRTGMPNNLKKFHKAAGDAFQEYCDSMSAANKRPVDHLMEFHAKIQRDLAEQGIGYLDDDVY